MRNFPTFFNEPFSNSAQCSHLYFRRLCDRTTDCCHWSWSRGGDKKCWLKMMKLSVVPGSASNHISGSKICTNKCEPGTCVEHANYPGGDIGGDTSNRHVTETFHECRCGYTVVNNSETNALISTS